jgi:hypothetical protein
MLIVNFDAHFLDAKVKGVSGGTGQVFPWKLARRAKFLPETLVRMASIKPIATSCLPSVAPMTKPGDFNGGEISGAESLDA